jgi:hypothetical protein
MPLVILHGVAGGWDELLIALVAFGVMWIAVKLASRKRVDDDEDDEVDEASDSAVVVGDEANGNRKDDKGDKTTPEEHKDPTHPPATKIT